MLRSIFSLAGRIQRAVSPKSLPHRSPLKPSYHLLALEQLEDRTLLAIFPVSNLLDNLNGAPAANSLRAAFEGVRASNDASNTIMIAGNLSGNLGVID